MGWMGWEQVRLQGHVGGHCNTDGGRGQDHVMGTDTTSLPQDIMDTLRR